MRACAVKAASGQPGSAPSLSGRWQKIRRWVREGLGTAKHLSGPQCKPCLFILRDLCLHGQDPRLCESYARYAETGDTRFVADAAGLAKPAALESAKMRAVQAGVIPQEALL